MVVERLREIGVLAIVRRVPSAQLDATVGALVAGGLRAVEVTADTDGALDAVRRWRETHPDVCVGVGTVLDTETAAAAVDAGAQFLVSPNTDPRVIATAAELGVDMLAGALTPTEVLQAWDAGATAVKVFPVSALGGPPYIAAIRAPLPHIPMVAVGGVRPADVRAYLDAGAVAAALGSSLVDDGDVAAGRFDAIESRARAIVEAAQRP
jgi:2-dehydro-3-deoxyphosphogluconate aldolase/(4S)-4-hydroxy-2-oxoglutarate aldolase